jgi:hypothetical protein
VILSRTATGGVPAVVSGVCIQKDYWVVISMGVPRLIVSAVFDDYEGERMSAAEKTR